MAYLTKHACQRSSQRGIPEAAIDFLLDHGDIESGWGTDSYVFNRPAKRHLRKEIGRDVLHQMERYLRIYAVVGGNGRVITVAWRRRRARPREVSNEP